MKSSVFSIDLAKHRFQVHGYDRRGERCYAKTHTRTGLRRLFLQQEAGCEVVMEACGSAHHWGRYLQGLGYRVRLIPAQHVRAYVVGNKTDANDADAIYAASRRKDLRPVAVKGVEQEDACLVHVERERQVKARTALVNQLRGVLAERGVVFGKQTGVLRRGVLNLLAQERAGEVTELLRRWMGERLTEWRELDERIKGCEAEMRRSYAQTPACQRLGAVEGVGVITATAAVALLGDGRQYRTARQCAAAQGLTPRERSSGERRLLGGITKRGDGYLRKLLVHGARSAVVAARRKQDARSRWVNELVARRGHNKAVVALANKNARVLWALLTTGEPYRPAAEAV